MASISNSTSAATNPPALASSRPVTLPIIPELFYKNFLDILIPASKHDMVVDEAPPTPRNPLMDALKENTNRTYTDNGAPAFISTKDPVLDAFNGLTHELYGVDVGRYLTHAWNKDPNLTLRLIWNLRSIHDGVGEKELFYRAFGWLYDNHPRTAISNLHNLVTPVCTSKKTDVGKAHGYWKDLLNILALATVDELGNISEPSKFLHSPRMPFTYGCNKIAKVGTPESRIEAGKLATQKAKVEAAAARKAKEMDNYKRLVRKLARPKFRALYIAVARLFANQLVEDKKTLAEIDALRPGQDRLLLIKKLGLAGKWAPTPGCSHDKVTNISTAIAELIYASQSLPANHYPAALKHTLPDHERAVILRSFYQRWFLTQLRHTAGYPEPLMSAGRWKQIKYSRVSSIAMKNNTPHFFKHDPEGFETYLTGVEDNKRSISGTTLLPHELVAQAVKLNTPDSGKKGKVAAMLEFEKKRAATQLRVVEAQWKTLLDSLREAGTIENSLAICDVSGSMGSLFSKYQKRHVQPILPSVSLSLVLASIAKPPFSGGFITFSSRPQFVTVDTALPLYEQVASMVTADWGMNTDLRAVFVDLLLPLAVRNRVAPADMVRRVFVFSDMQFDASQPRGVEGEWETTHDVIARAYKAAGYEVPEIVYWDLAAATGRRTVEVEETRKGVAMMNGFSPAMLKVFMGEEDAEEMEWESVDADEENVTVVERAEKEEANFNPVNIMKKALMRASYDGLVVVD